MHALTAWLKTANPDILCLQEIKTVDDGFPRMELEAMGYNVAVHGQKSYNGVAILSKLPFDEVNIRLPGDDTDEQARYIEAVVSIETGAVRVASIYLPMIYSITLMGVMNNIHFGITKRALGRKITAFALTTCSAQRKL